MDTIPPEIIHQIVLQLPKSSLPSFRLASRTFNVIAFPYLFSHIPHWLDYERSHQTIIALAQDVFNRPAVMWSPWASEPDGPIDEVWMGIVWKVLMRGDHPRMKGGLKGDWEKLTPGNFGKLSGRVEITENRLRTGQNRFLMYRDYVFGTSGLVMNTFDSFDSRKEGGSAFKQGKRFISGYIGICVSILEEIQDEKDSELEKA